MMRYSCTVLSPGQAAGPVHIASSRQAAPALTRVTVEEARDAAATKLAAHSETAKTGGDILLAQKAMLEDPELLTRVQALTASGETAQVAIHQACEEYAAVMDAADDPYLKERAADIREVEALWSDALAPVAEAPVSPGAIVVCQTLLVQDMLDWAQVPVAGVIAGQGSPLMHAALIAQNLGIPVVTVQSRDFRDQVTEGERVAIDTQAGWVDTEPPASSPGHSASAPARIAHPISLPGGAMIEVRANISSLPEAEKIAATGADGVGLFRTEMLLEQAGRLLSAAEQEEIYREAVQKSGKPVIFRTFDIGADKSLAFLDLPSEPNPALGLRGMRMYREHETLLHDQLTALYRASQAGAISVMFPMVASVEDWDFCRDSAARVSEEVGGGAVALGVMVEVPSVGFLVPELVRHQAAFGSLGTNDLSQYFFASDRESRASHQSGLALVRFIHMIAQEAQASHWPLGVCGQLAADPGWAVLFAAMGIYSLSVPLPAVQPVKELLNRVHDFGDLVDQATQDPGGFARTMSQWAARD